MNLAANFRNLTDVASKAKDLLRVESRKNEKEREYYYHLSNR